MDADKSIKIFFAVVQMVSESGLDSYVGCIRLQSNSNWRDNIDIVSTHYINLITVSPKS